VTGQAFATIHESCNRCSCGRPIQHDPDNPRARTGGDLIEYCRCPCGSTPGLFIEACGHGAAVIGVDGQCMCRDCGHRWTQHGADYDAEIVARAQAPHVVGYNDRVAGRDRP
jgi:hypothetical protein